MGEIKGNDIFEASAIKAPLEFAKNMDVALNKVDQFIELMKKSEAKIGVAKSTKDIATETKKLTKSKTELQKIEKQILTAQQKSTDAFIKQKAALDKLNKSNREAVKDVNAQKDAYDKLDRELISTRKAYKDLAAAGKANTAEAKKLLTQTKKLDSQLKKIDNTVGQNQRSVGKYSNALKGVTARFLGWAAVAATLFRALKSGITIVLNYSKANSVLRGILRKTKEETIELRKQQQELGKSTAFTATQVTKSQTELARLGFTMGQIIDLTPAILDASVALGVDMAEAAELVAGQLNAFGKATGEGAQVADVLTRSTQISSLTFERLKNSLDKVGKVSDISNVSLEKTVATLGAVTDTNIKAEKAGTAFRNILLLSAKAGIPYEEMLQKINDSSTKAKTAVELFGKQNAAVAIVIAENTEKINENTKSLDNAAGAAKEFADEALDNLSGDLTLASSVWEGFILSLEEGDGILAKAIRAVIGLTTEFLGFLTALSETHPGLSKFAKDLKNLSIEEQEKELKKLSDQALIYSNSLERVNISTEEFLKLSANQRSDVRRARRDSEEVQKDLDFVNEKINLLTQSLEKKGLAEKEAAERARIAALERAAAEKEANTKIVESRRLLNEFLNKGDADHIFKGKQTFLEEVEARKKSNDDIKKIRENLTKDLITIDKRVTDANKAASDERVRIAEEEAKEKERIDKIAAEAKQAFIDLEFELASESANRFTDLRLQRIDQEINALEMARNRELEVEGITAEQKDAINTKFDQKKKDLQRKQANAEKQNALFQIAINTAVAVTKITAEAALAAPFLIPGIIALGAVQAAAVLAAPLPQFDKGSERTPADYIAGEKRPELRKSGGKWGLVKEPTMFKNSPGDTIVSGKETDSILGSMTDLTGKNMLTDPGLMLGLLNNDFEKKKATTDLAYIIKKGDAEIVRAIKNQKLLDIRVNTARAFVTERNGQTRIDHIKTQYRS